MNIPGVYQRDKRHSSQMYHPMHHSTASYWTEAFGKPKMKHDFDDDIFNNIHLIPDPLKKNLADSLFNTETPMKPEKMYQQDQKMAGNGQEVPSEKPPKQTTALGGIGSFFSGVMNVLTNVMFRSRATNYYDCFDVDSQGQAWQHARTDVQDKNGQGGDCTRFDAPPNPNVSSEMNFDSRHAVTGCERKLNQVLHLLTPRQTSSPVWVRKRPKKVFVEPGSVEESFEDAFSPEDFCSLPDDSYIEYYSPLQYHPEELFETAAQKTKLNMAPVEEKTDIIKEVTKNDLNKKDEPEKESMQLEQESVLLEKDDSQLENSAEREPEKVLVTELNMGQQLESKTLDVDQTDSCPTIKEQLVSSCEDKLSRLKALLQEKRMKCRSKRDVTETSHIPETSRTTPPKVIETKTADKHYKNPNRRCNKRSKARLKCRIEDDLVFANEINLGTPPSAENSPAQHNVSFGDYFDEVSGRFRTASTGSDDSFQIVFNECHGRVRRPSDCDSEDSFIVFEDSPESCYVSNDVFDSDSESEMSDSGCAVTCKLAHSLTRTVGNLADDSLYVSEDEVDFCMDMREEVVEKTGLLLDEKKKLKRKCQPSKKVHFSTDPPKVHVMRVWAFAARQARAGHWERYAVDRERFKRRIADVDMALSWVLKPQHRRRVMFQRFMPWWNQLKRKELAEKKEKEEEEKRRQEEEKLEEDRLKGETVQDVNNERADELENISNTNTEEKCFKSNESGHKECNDSKVICSQGNELEINNSLNNDSGKVSNFIIESDALAKKLQDIEIENIKIVQNTS